MTPGGRALATPRRLALLLGLGSGAVLLGALGLQYLGGVAPCPLCIWQRWPHLAVLLIGLLGWAWWPRPMLALAGLVLLGSAGLAGYHVGIEEGVWALPAGCAAGQEASTVEELRQLLAEAPPACDQVGFTVLGLSLASWNGVNSLALAALALWAAWRAGAPRQARAPAAVTEARRAQ